MQYYLRFLQIFSEEATKEFVEIKKNYMLTLIYTFIYISSIIVGSVYISTVHLVESA